MEALAGLAWWWLTRPAQIVGRWLKPSIQRDPHIENLQRARTSLAYLGLIALLVLKQWDQNGQDTVTSLISAPLIKAVIALPCFLLAVTFLAWKRPAGARLRFVRGASVPWLIAIGVTATPIVVALLAWWRFGAALTNGTVSAPWLAFFALSAAPLLIAALWSQVIAVRHSFRASDVHPLMPAVVGMAIAVVTAVYGTIDSLQADSDLQQWLGLFSVAGCGVAGLLSNYEFRRVRANGWSWHDGYVWIAPRSADGLGTWMAFVLVPVAVLAIAPSHRPAEATANSLIAGVPADPAPLQDNAKTAQRTQRVASETTTAQATKRSTTRPTKLGSMRSTKPSAIRPTSVSASAAAQDGEDSSGRPVTFQASNVTDGRMDTAWRMEGDGTGATITMKLPARMHITSVGLVPGYAKDDPESGGSWFTRNRRVTSVTWSTGSGRDVAQTFVERPTLQSKAIDLTGQTVTITITKTSRPGDRDYTAISEVSIVGLTA